MYMHIYINCSIAPNTRLFFTLINNQVLNICNYNIKIITNMVLLLSLLTSAAAVMAVPLIAETRDSQPNPKDIYIENGSYGGSGCPGGSVGFALSNDATSSVKMKASPLEITNMPIGLPYRSTSSKPRRLV
jgi:hypothetical protein